MDRFVAAKQNAQLVKVGGIVVDMLDGITEKDAYITVQQQYAGPGTCLVVLVRGEEDLIDHLTKAIPKLVKRARNKVNRAPGV